MAQAKCYNWIPKICFSGAKYDTFDCPDCIIVYIYCELKTSTGLSVYSASCTRCYWPLFSTKRWNIFWRRLLILLDVSFSIFWPLRLSYSMALWAEGGWKLKLTRVHATEYEIYVTKYLLVWKKTRAASVNIRNNVF